MRRWRWPFPADPVSLSATDKRQVQFMVYGRLKSGLNFYRVQTRLLITPSERPKSEKWGGVEFIDTKRE